MAWYSFGTGLMVGIVIGAFALELLHIALGGRERKKLPLDPHLR